MTEGQVRYQNLMETQRHNLEMERLGQVEAEAKKSQAESSRIQANAAHDKVAYAVSKTVPEIMETSSKTVANITKAFKDFMGGGISALFG